jgi:hypothetical protein
MHWGLERAVDGWLTRVEKVGSCLSPSFAQQCSARDDTARHHADGKPAFGLRAISGHAATKRPVKVRLCFLSRGHDPTTTSGGK